MLLILNLLMVQSLLLVPLGGGSVLNWGLWKHYSPATSSMVTIGVFFGQMILTQAWPKWLRVALFTVFVGAATSLGPWLQRTFEDFGAAAFSREFYWQSAAALDLRRFYLLVGTVAVITLLRSSRFR